MKITAIKTRKILPNQTSLTRILDKHLKRFPERSILVITSKIVSLCEGRTAPLTQSKEKLLRQEVDYYMEEKFRIFGPSGIAITHSAFLGAGGIDESNTNGNYVLLPKDSAKTAELIYQYLKKRFRIQECGVIITDSHSTPLRRGASGIALAYRGFVGLKDYRGTADLFGRKMIMEQANVTDALASGAVLVMGEGAEQTPLALIEDVPAITFRANAPTKKELAEFFVDIKNDIFASLFNLKRLKKGKKKPDLA
jgi:F420-0:gamma-glutamyl ligase